jgi:hypothetical protein
MTTTFTAMAPTQTKGAFIDQLLDWRDFEAFVQAMYAEDPNLVVEHDVTEVGKSGARRQIDVKVTQKTKLHTYVTLVECKRWKEKIDRQRVDVLFASIEDLGASKGVIFTTSGYEAGAELYAKSKNIDLFVVRDLTDAEWGLPGRQVWFYWHLFMATISSITSGVATLHSVVEQPPKDLKLDIHIEKDSPHDEALALYSVVDGARGPNLAALLLDARVRAMDEVSKAIPVLKDGADGASLLLVVPITLDLSGFTFRQLLFPYGALRMDRIALMLKMCVQQSRFEIDRGAKYDIALAVENYMTRQRNVVARVGGSAETTLSEPIPQRTPNALDADVLQNGSLIRVFTDPFVSFEENTDQVGFTNELIFELPTWTVRRGETPPIAKPPSPEKP